MTLDEYLRYDAVGLAELVRKREIRPTELAETALGLAHDRVPLALAAHVVVQVDGLAAEVGRHLLAEVVEDVAEHDLGSLGGEEAGLGLALAPGPTRDERNLPVQSAHDSPFPLALGPAITVAHT